ncbi:MAG TPA: response regulator [Pyrinomonadaceae bacterium]|jgi:DNA-binding NtrC family response regulator
MSLLITHRTKEVAKGAAHKDRRILIVDSDDQFREGLYNFLLAAGYDDVDATKTFHAALARIRKSAYDVVVSNLDSRFSEGLAFAKRIVKVNPQMKLILMIGIEDQDHWAEEGALTGIQFLLKPTFPRNLLYLLQH